MRIALKPLAEQVIVITGASSGIGLVTARAAAERGASVFLIARNGEALAEIVDAIVAAGGSAAWHAADVGDPVAVRAAAAAAVARFGWIDSWVNDAGVAIYAKLVDTPADEHERLFRTNYFGVVNGALAAVEHLRANGGALITVGSIVSDLPSPIMGAYAASKHAAKGFVDSLRIELNADRVPISVTLIKPSGTDTPIAEHAANHQAGEALIPPPVYDPDLVARAILDAAVRPRREVTVGGVGRLQAIAGLHFPGLLAWLGGAMMPLLEDRGRAKTPTDNLDRPQAGGAERSGVTAGRRLSLYAIAQHRAGWVTGAALLGIAAVAIVRNSRRMSAT